MVRSSSLVPANDPTLLFTNAGMNQFKDVFLGLEKRDYSRAASSQKCVRAGGKHNDLENVGYTRRHHTFFEMLGNFSFGDYFKAEAIEFAWDLITKDYGLPKDKLYVTVFREDDEAEAALAEGGRRSQGPHLPARREGQLLADGRDRPVRSVLGDPLRPGRRSRRARPRARAVSRAMPAAASSRSGTSSSCSSTATSSGQADAAAAPVDRYRHGPGAHRRGPAGQALQLRDRPDPPDHRERRADCSASTPGDDARVDTALRIAADHARATAFLIHDGVMPSNEGRGYVLRKIMRRAMRNARMIGVEDPFLYKMTGFVAELMQAAYPELMESVQRVARVVKDEEHRYATTFLVAEKMFNDDVEGSARARASRARSPSSCTTPTAWRSTSRRTWRASTASTIDRDGFESEMEQQRERARASWKGAEKGAVVPAYQKLLEQGRTKFLGYSDLEATSRVIGLLVDKQPVEQVAGGREGRTGARPDAVLRRSRRPGGRSRRRCITRAGEKVADVETAFPGVPGLTVHRITTHAPIAVGDDAARAKWPRRCAMPRVRNHTATHLLHAVAAPGARHARQAGGQRGGARPPALRLHALRGDGPRRDSTKWSG